MTRRRIVGLGYAVCVLASVGLLACSGDDTNPPPPDAGSADATTSDAGATDATTPIDSGAPEADANGDALACTPVDAGTFTDAEVAAGFAIVVARKCQQCHGDDLGGNPNGLPSTNEEGGTAYPPDLTPDPTTGLACWSNREIERAFLDGINKAGQPMCNPMPHFGEEGDAGIDEAGAGAVIAYLRSIPPVVRHVPENSACPPPTAPPDAGRDAGFDAGFDAGLDASSDAGEDASEDATVDAGDATTADAGADADDGGPGDAGDAD
jgi:hypothetical protein